MDLGWIDAPATEFCPTAVKGCYDLGCFVRAGGSLTSYPAAVPGRR